RSARISFPAAPAGSGLGGFQNEPITAGAVGDQRTVDRMKDHPVLAGLLLPGDPPPASCPVQPPNDAIARAASTAPVAARRGGAECRGKSVGTRALPTICGNLSGRRPG